MTTVKAVNFQLVTIPMLEPFGIATGSVSVSETIAVMVELSDSNHGFGEAAPLCIFNGDNLEAARVALDHARLFFIGIPIDDWEEVSADWKRLLKQDAKFSGAAVCALETALLDAWCRSLGIPLWVHFGGALSSVTSDFTVTQLTEIPHRKRVEQARASAMRGMSLGATVLKVKVGGISIDQDLDRLSVISEVSTSSGLILDANASLSAESALALIQHCEKIGSSCLLFEQPTALGNWREWNWLRVRTDVPLCVDEGLTDRLSAYEAALLGRPAFFNVKLMKYGLTEALEIIQFARSEGIRLMIGGMLETWLGMTHSALLAAGRGYFEFIDLDTPLFLVDNPFVGGARWEGARIIVPAQSPGSGIEVSFSAD